MNNINQPAFYPKPASTVTLAVTTSSAAVQFQTAALSRHIRVANTGTGLVFIELGQTGVAATTTASMPLLPNEVEIFSVGSAQWLAAIGAATSTIYVTPGEGM